MQETEGPKNMIIRKGIKKLLVNVMISVISVTLLLVSLEFVIRASYYLKFARNAISPIQKGKVSDKTFNIYCFGGSTMVGEPYEDSLSIPQLASYMLHYKIQDKNIRIINMADYGQDFRYVLDELKLILKRRDIAYPSLCLIYSGHNEFSKYYDEYGYMNKQNNINMAIGYVKKYSYLIREIMNRVKPKRYYLEIDERRFFDRFPHTISDNQRIIERYKAEIVESIGLLHKYNVPCIISTVAGNYADWEPNRSVFCGDDADKEEFKQLMDSGNLAQVKAMDAEAIAHYLKALSICNGFAETHYRLGKCYERLGDFELAWQEYQKAVNDDGMPIRATEAQNNFVRAIPEDNVIFTVDAVAYLRKNSEHGNIGFNLMIDGEHPNLKGYILISQLIAEKIQQIFHETKQLRSLSEEEAKDKFSINQHTMFEIYISRGRWFTRVSTLRYDPSNRLKLAELCFNLARAINGSQYEPYVGLAMCSFLRKNVFQAEQFLSLARTIDPEEVNKYLNDSWINQIVTRAYH